MTANPALRPVICVVGGGGLLGSALTRAVHRSGGSSMVPRVRWAEPSAAIADLRRAVTTMLGRARAEDRDWQLVWSAGAGVAGTSPDDLAAEVRALGALLGAVAEHLGRDARSADLAARGAVFVASSVGGVYGGTLDPPYTENHPVAAISDYGWAKLAGEKVAREFAEATGVPVVIGRITNLYGPGQDLAKPQGLISHLCRAHLTRSSISVYVPLDTIRDYLFVDDCAKLVLDALDQARTEHGVATTKIIGAHQAVTIGALLGEFRRVFKRAPLVLLGGSNLAKHQAKDLRIRSVVWPELDRRTLTPLPAGLAATAEDLYRTVKGAG